MFGNPMMLAPRSQVQPDPNAAYRQFLLSGRGANGAIPATTDIGNKAITLASGAAITTSRSKWPSYGSCLDLDTPTTSPAMNVAWQATGVGDWRVNMWLYNPGQSLWLFYQSAYNAPIYSQADTGAISVWGTGTAPQSFGVNAPLNAWYFLEFGYIAATQQFALSIDGVVAAARHNYSASQNSPLLSVHSPNAYISDMAGYVGIPPRTTNFSPPTTAYLDTYS